MPDSKIDELLNYQDELNELENNPNNLDNLELIDELMDVNKEDELIDDIIYDSSENLVKYIPDHILKKLSTDLMEEIKNDIESRREWDEILADSIKYIGILKSKKSESGTNTNSILSHVTDPLLLQSLLNFLSSMKDIIGDSPTDYKVNGPSSEEIEFRSDKVVDFLNVFLTVYDKFYKKDDNKHKFYVGLTGTAFKHVYQDPIKNVPKSRTVKPTDMILDNSATCLEECERITYAYTLSKKSIQQYINSGFFVEHETLSAEKEKSDKKDNKFDIEVKNIYGIDDVYDKSHLFRYFQSQVYWDVDELKELEKKEINFPLPYIVHICSQTSEIVGVYRGWDEDSRNYERLNLFNQTNFLEGPGLYGLGLMQLLLEPSKVLSKSEKLYLDSIQFSLYPGLLMLGGAKIDKPNIQLEPGDIHQVSGFGGKSINEVIMPLPYKEPSPTMMAFIQNYRNLFSSIDWTLFNKIQENSINAPVGTTLAMLDVQHRIQSMVMQNILDGFQEELQMLIALFKKLFREDPFVIKAAGKEFSISRDDFLDNVTIIPSFKSDISTRVQKIMTNDAIRQSVQMSPALFDLKEVQRRFLKDLKVDDIDSLFVKEEKVIPLDPITENMMALQNKPIKAAEYQDHKAYISIRQAFMQRPEVQANPQALQILNANILEHYAMQYKLEMEQYIGFQLPPLEELNNPNIQNEIAIKVLPIAQQQQQAIQAQQPKDPVDAMLAEVDQRREAAQLKSKSDADKVELEAYKAKLAFEGEQRKIDIEQQIAEERNETALEIEQLKSKP